jgi:hypothetical protein
MNVFHPSQTRIKDPSLRARRLVPFEGRMVSVNWFNRYGTIQVKVTKKPTPKVDARQKAGLSVQLQKMIDAGDLVKTPDGKYTLP